MAIQITMPQLSDTMGEGKIVSWLKAEGDPVKRGDALAEVATDKTNLEIESYYEGTLAKIVAAVGSTIKVGDVIALLSQPGEAKPEPENAPVQLEQDTEPEEPRPRVSAADERIRISPLAHNLADKEKVDYSQLTGTGEGGRITRRDVEEFIRSKRITAPTAPPAAKGERGEEKQPPPWYSATVTNAPNNCPENEREFF